MLSVAGNLLTVRERIARAVERSGRNAKDVKLVGVTKTIPLEKIAEAISAGLTDIGENRVQEAAGKFPMLQGVRKHLIGHLQSNKVAAAVELFDVIQTVDSLKLARKISGAAVKKGKIIEILVQVRTDLEKDFGVASEDVENVMFEMKKLSNLKITGLMTIGPQFALEEKEKSREVFREMKKLFDSVKYKFDLRELSMGMSDDYEIAIEEGATIVRIGRAIFGERNYA